jgi:flagellar basal body rod protein FlgG
MASGNDFGLSVAESGLDTAQATLAVWANNLANQSTPGFEEAVTGTTAGPVVALPTPASAIGPDTAPGGVVMGPPVTDTSPGPIVTTGNATDLALTVPGYFPIRTPSGLQLTRNGQFHRDSLGQLVTPGGGVLLGLNLKPVVIPPGPFTVENGAVKDAGGQVVAQLAVAAVPNPSGLLASGGSLLVPTPESGPPTIRPALGQDVLQGALVGSNVQVANALAALVTAAGQFSEMATVVKVGQQLSVTTNGLAVLA